MISYYWISGKYCFSNNLFVEGYALGLLTIIFVLLIITTIDMCLNEEIDIKNRDNDNKNIDKKEDEKKKEE